MISLTRERTIIEALAALGLTIAGFVPPLRDTSLVGDCVRVRIIWSPFMDTSVGDLVIQIDPFGFEIDRMHPALLEAAKELCHKIRSSDNPGVVGAAGAVLDELSDFEARAPGAVAGIEFIVLQTTPSGKELCRIATTDGNGRAVLADLFLDRPCTIHVIDLDLDKALSPFEHALEAFSMQGACASFAGGGADKFPAISGTLAKWGLAYTLKANGPNACVLALATPFTQKDKPPAMILYLGPKHKQPLKWDSAVGGGFVCVMSIPIPAAKFARILQHPLLIRHAGS